jgi:hypothetical protein
MFRGKDDENVMSWLNKTEKFFAIMGVKEHQKVGAVCNSLEGEADHFYWYLEERSRRGANLGSFAARFY